MQWHIESESIVTSDNGLMEQLCTLPSKYPMQFGPKDSSFFFTTFNGADYRLKTKGPTKVDVTMRTAQEYQIILEKEHDVDLDAVLHNKKGTLLEIGWDFLIGFST